MRHETSRAELMANKLRPRNGRRESASTRVLGESGKMQAQSGCALSLRSRNNGRCTTGGYAYFGLRRWPAAYRSRSLRLRRLRRQSAELDFYLAFGQSTVIRFSALGTVKTNYGFISHSAYSRLRSSASRPGRTSEFSGRSARIRCSSARRQSVNVAGGTVGT